MGKEKTTDLWEMFEKGVEYQNSINLRDNIPRYIDYYEGRQWKKEISQATKSMPRCVVNMIKPICRNKKANILSVPYRLVFSSINKKKECETFTRFVEYQNKVMGINEIDRKAVDSGTKKGTYIYHFYWDKDAINVIEGKKGGALACELLDPLNVFFANPREVDEQKQKWILIASRVDVDTVRALLDKDIDEKLIESDLEENNAYDTKEQDGSNLVTLLTRYFRKNGEVYCERATKTTVVNKPFSITPDLNKAKREISGQEDAPEAPVTDTATKQTIKAKLYPIVVGQYEPRDSCIYGLSEVEGIIPNQQAVNQIVSMQVYNVQQNGWAKWKVTPKALNGQKITNDAGQVLIDYDPSGNGISKIKDEGFSTAPIKISEDIISLTRNACGSNEVTNGEVLGANMSGSAIAQLQAQASLPTEELREAFWATKVKCGKVMVQFFLLFYDKEKFIYVDPSDNEQKEQEKEMDMSVFAGMTPDSFDIQVEAIGGSRATTASDIQFLEAMFKQGAIDALTFAKLYPNDAIANKSAVISELNNARNDKVAILTQQVQELQAQLQQVAPFLKDTAKIVQENNTLKAQLLGLYREATAKMAIADEAINQFGAVKQDAEMFANEIYKERQAQQAKQS